MEEIHGGEHVTVTCEGLKNRDRDHSYILM